jgi:hypothetical protein
MKKDAMSTARMRKSLFGGKKVSLQSIFFLLLVFFFVDKLGAAGSCGICRRHHWPEIAPAFEELGTSNGISFKL